ncbi:GDSL-type esterase/lipase family protein [Pseudoflavonifractor phocaeensis]|uniref:GDSL-type esterase/lipase family protein n=1 Tax=Pseudoflavonifractor phocaeensis TaxID=1870988 RepID=UPI00195C5B0C|nr:GDSL-type esterase/lipase family protein [Pseudoflavonifractor phocaeensis]MBM6926506.1 hypothetical protein [Pseudoflavonifractor phocaeensis]
MKKAVHTAALTALTLALLLSAAGCGGGGGTTASPSPVASATPSALPGASSSPAVEPSATPAPVETPVDTQPATSEPTASAQPASGSVTPVAWSWFDDAVFVGDSISLKLTGYVSKMRQSDPSFLGKAQFLTAGSLGSGNALWDVSSESVHPLYQGTKMRLEDSIAACGAKKLYILLGMNDVGMYGIDGSVANMETLLKLILEKTPDLQIFVQSATPIHKGNELKVLNNANLVIYNQGLQEMCQRNGWHYVDVASVLRDADGYLPDAYCSDASGMGMHFTDQACQVWIDYLRQDAGAYA